MDDFILNGYVNDDGTSSGSGYQYANNKSYRYGFNGQEKSDEVKGEGNSYTAEFWEYDPRVARRWNLDPKPSSTASNYSVLGDSPIWLADLLGDKGDTLSYNVSNNETSADIASIVKKDNQKFINFNPLGTVELSNEFRNLPAAEQQRLLNSDEGLSLLNSMINNVNNYYYSTTDRVKFKKTDVSGVPMIGPDGRDLIIDVNLSDKYNVGDKLEDYDPADPNIYPLFLSFTNLSNTIRGDEATVGYGQKPSRETKINSINGSFTRKFDGEVYIAPGSFYAKSIVGTIKIQVPRAAVVFHEMRENFLRVGGMSYPNAHNQAIMDALKTVNFGMGYSPGENFSFFILGSTTRKTN
ncbi:hypothetical protein [Ferruginibacter sp. HRS2-29]|uniref:hypothetical protein n=1 Tax=Ferruginibacter sp. HRS2-29 TaxID=2487334 RepID=UPI0020CEC49B|nr:hypothetical protein [Ferruginibacter sp. HRS2-29]